MAKYNPGNEPDSVRLQLDVFFKKLDEIYPDKVVVGIHNDHKKLGEKLTALYHELEYEDGAAFLAAYGYRFEKKVRKTMSDAELAEREQKLYEALMERYPNGFDGKSLNDLKVQNPDLSKWFSSTEKYLSSKGTTLREKLKEKGFFRINKVTLPEEEIKQTSEVILTDKDLEIAVNRVKMAVLQKYGFVRMFCTVKEANEDASTYCRELVDDVCKRSGDLALSQEQLKQLYDAAGLTGQAVVDLVNSKLKTTDHSLLVFDGKGKLMGCSLYEKGNHHERPKKGTVDLVIPPGVTALGSRIFSEWTSLRSVYIPDTVTKIGSGCFYGCTALRTVRLSKNLQELPSKIFGYTKSLKQIELPVALTEIKNCAFDSSGLTAITIPENVASICGDAFIECNKLLDITITGKLTAAMTTGDIEHIFDIEYKKEKYKKFKFTVELEQNPEMWAAEFADHGFSAKASKKKRAKYGCVNLYEWFRVAGLLNKQNQIMGDSDFNQFVTSMKESIQDTGYNLGEEQFTRWLDDMTDMGYDYTYHNAFFKVNLKNATFAAVETFSLLKQKGAFVDGSYAECPEFKIKIEDIMEFVCCLRMVDKSTEIQVNCYIGGWSSLFAGYSFTLNEGQYFPSFIYLNEFLRM